MSDVPIWLHKELEFVLFFAARPLDQFIGSSRKEEEGHEEKW